MSYCSRCDKEGVTTVHRCFTIFSKSSVKEYESKGDYLKNTISGKLFKRIKEHPELKQWAQNDKDFPERLYHGHWQVSEGAWSWGLKFSNLGSPCSMSECLKAKKWDIFYSHGKAEIIIEKESEC